MNARILTFRASASECAVLDWLVRHRVAISAGEAIRRGLRLLVEKTANVPSELLAALYNDRLKASHSANRREPSAMESDLLFSKVFPKSNTYTRPNLRIPVKAPKPGMNAVAAVPRKSKKNKKVSSKPRQA